MAGGRGGMLVIPVTADIEQTKRNLAIARAELEKLGGTAAREGGKAGGAFTRLGNLGSSLKHKLLGPLSSIAPALGAAGLVEFGREAFQTAMEGQAAEARLAAAVKATGQAYESQKGRIDTTIGRMRNLGFAGDETKAALARLVMTTHNTAKATDEMGLAANIARARHIGLEDAATLVGKVMSGNTAVLKRMGIDLGLANGGLAAQKKAQDAVRKAQEAVTVAEKKAAEQHGHSRTANDALARARQHLTDAEAKLKAAHDASGTALSALNRIMGGQAVAASETAAGKIEILKAQFHDLKESIGNKLIGAFMFIAHHIAVIGPIVAGLVGGLIAYKVVSGAVAVANAIMGTSFEVAQAPIAPIIAALVAIGVVGYLLVKHWHTIWGDIKKWAGDAWHFLNNDVFKPIEHAVGFLVSVWVTEFRVLADVFLNFVGMMLHGAAAAFGWIPGIGGKLKHARDAFDTFHKNVDDTLTGVANSARNWGKKTADNFASGILTGKGAVAAAAQAVAVETQHRLRTASPARLGPLSTMGGPEGWGRRLASGYAAGIARAAPRAGDAAELIARSVTNRLGLGATMPLRLSANEVARAVGAGGSVVPYAASIARTQRAQELTTARTGPMVGARASAGGGDTIINLHVTIEGTVYRTVREIAVELRDELAKLVKRGGSAGVRL